MVPGQTVIQPFELPVYGMNRVTHTTGYLVLVILDTCLCTIVSASIGSHPIGGDRGWCVFHCHADGTVISLDNEEKGVITDGELPVPIYTTGTPYTSYTATYDGDGYHQSITRPITEYPAKGQTVDIYVDITSIPTPMPTPEPRPIGGDQGWYEVYGNVREQR